MTSKTSIRFFENIPVRAVWDDESARWWFCASKNPAFVYQTKVGFFNEINPLGFVKCAPHVKYVCGV